MQEVDEQDKANWQWAGRPLRNLTDKEIERAIEDRREAVASATSEIARQFCQIALDRLQAEQDGRLARREWRS